jgi:hypothetical protein
MAQATGEAYSVRAKMQSPRTAGIRVGREECAGSDAVDGLVCVLCLLSSIHHITPVRGANVASHTAPVEPVHLD